MQTALSQLPPEVQQQGVTVQKRSSAILQFLQFYSEGGKQDPLFISNYVTINVLDALSRTPGVGQAIAVRHSSTIRCASGSTSTGWSA